MEASEAIRRIFWRHRWLLLILMILPVVAIVPLKERQVVQYSATATIQGQGTTPDSDTQVQAIKSRVSAVGTDPALVQSAIKEAKVSRDATQVAQHEISVAPLGSSAIMVLTVTDPSGPAAMALARSLADWIVFQLNQLGIKDNPELAALGKTSSALATRRNQLLSQLGSANASNASTSVQVQSLLSQLGAVEQQQATNESRNTADTRHPHLRNRSVGGQPADVCDRGVPARRSRRGARRTPRLGHRLADRHGPRGDKADRGTAGSGSQGTRCRAARQLPTLTVAGSSGSTRTCPGASTWPLTGPESSRSC